jgi:peroxiredoxin Q/BCP
VRDEIEQFHEAGVQPFGVNPAGVDAHARYAASFNFGFPLLSDADRAMATAYGTLKEDGKGIQRTVYGIARDGTIAFAARGAPPPAEVIAALAP